MSRLRNIAMQDYQESVTTGQTDAGQSDPSVPLCFASDTNDLTKTSILTINTKSSHFYSQFMSSCTIEFNLVDEYYHVSEICKCTPWTNLKATINYETRMPPGNSKAQNWLIFSIKVMVMVTRSLTLLSRATDKARKGVITH